MRKYLAAAIVILLSCNKDVIPDMTSINGEILFISRRVPDSADWQIFLMNADGTNQRILSNELVTCSPPVVSNNGTKVAFTTYDNSFYYNLYVIDIDGANQKLLSRSKQFCGNPAWSPDDRRIAFVKNESNIGGTYDIYSINADGSNEIKLTSQNNNFSPKYFSNKNAIVFTSSNGTWSGIYKMNVDGSNKQLLTPQNKSFGDPKIAPGDRQVAVTSLDWSGSQIFVMNADGSQLRQLTFTVSSVYFDTGFPRDGNCNPSWSPHGDKLAYVSFENGSPDVFVINADGKSNKRLTNTPLRDEDPTWTKDGNYILFSSNRAQNVSAEIYIMRPGGQSQTPLTKYIADDIYPTFIAK